MICTENDLVNLRCLRISEFLVLDKFFPRSILRCLMHAEQCLNTISGSPAGYTNKAERILGLFKSQLEFAEVGEIFSFGLHEYLDNLQEQLNDL